ncbi:DUF4352 domain-containing protein [Streptomyces roseolilacinus]|uniref:DUF4352 domain-containing protein n=1 Tax=Streptomyces roseolilacinus TaxID=66904 RepID=A0A918B6S6_9ACTN|nr:DUF4352 domain-containing protein [Streptomyces roseolilacinus]GGQ33385.1 hypothetical protein GCM10010249_59880 [Streptomyces roseolilacinus]
MNKIKGGASCLLLAGVLVTGCSSTSEPTVSIEDLKRAASQAASPTPSPSASVSPGPVLQVGQRSQFADIETDEYGENPRAVTTFGVTVKEATYVDAADIGSGEPAENGQFVRLTLAITNVGKANGDFTSYGAIKWEDEQTAAQDATTLHLLDGPELDTEYKPGQSVTGSIVLDVARKGGTLTYWDSANSDAPAFSITLPTAGSGGEA